MRRAPAGGAPAGAPFAMIAEDTVVAELQQDVALLARAVSHLFRIPGAEGRWTVADFKALREVLERRDVG